jgi:hypothetical protein
LPKQWAQGKKATERGTGIASSGITTVMPGREGEREEEGREGGCE